MLDIIVALTAGIVAGRNWPKIKKSTAPHVKKIGENIIRGYHGLVEASKAKRRRKK